jgi:Domain of unknown function (DUF1833)
VRVLSLNFRKALFGQESGEVPIFLLTITHPDLPEPIYLTTDATERLGTDPLVYGAVSRGVTYLYAGVEIMLPDEQDKSPPTSKLIVANVGRDLIPLARSVNSPPSVRIETVLASSLDVVEIEWPKFDMSNLTYDANQLTFDLTVDSLATEPFPSGTFSPAYFPGLF